MQCYQIWYAYLLNPGQAFNELFKIYYGKVQGRRVVTIILLEDVIVQNLNLQN